MMKYLAVEKCWKGRDKTAGSKARVDVERILLGSGFAPLEVDKAIPLDRDHQSMYSKVFGRLTSVKDWRKALRRATRNDVIVLQLPLRNHSRGTARYLASLAHKGIKIVGVVHDLESFRNANDQSASVYRKREILYEEKTILTSCYRTILHNDAMCAEIRKVLGNVIADKAIPLGIFDYVIEESYAPSLTSLPKKSNEVIIAGNFERKKAGYVYSLPSGPTWNLYGIDYDGDSQDGVEYMGAFPADELPLHLRGSFGLVWDGDSIVTCEGSHGEYLRINNPHKASLYLACGIPVIIWDQAALASFVMKHKVGFTVSSLKEIASKIEKLPDENYAEMRENAEALSKTIRNGGFLRKAIARTTLTIEANV